MEDPLANIYTSSNKKVIIWRVISLILFIFLVTVGVLYALGIGYKKYGNLESELTLWNSNSAIYTKLVPYIRDITDKSTSKIKTKLLKSFIKYLSINYFLFFDN